MKKSSIIKIAAAFIIVIAIIILVVLLQSKPAPEPEFAFLKGRELTATIVDYRGIMKETRFVYSFPMDFAEYIEIEEDINSELFYMGYKRRYVANDYPMSGIKYYLPGESAFDDSVSILYGLRMNDVSAPKNEYIEKTGYVSVEVVKYQEQNRFIAETRKFIKGTIDWFKNRNLMD